MQTEKVADYIMDWLKIYAKNAGVKGFVLGISGGVDSAVVSTLCARTGMDVLCLELPILQTSTEVSRAKEQLDFLTSNFPNVSRKEVDLTPVFLAFTQALPKEGTQQALDLTLANTRSRLRMTALYFFAGIHRLLVAGTGNKIEDFGVGFFTKYGDGGVDISPIGDLLKSEVYLLAKTLQVPTSILEAIPTDGLFGDNRTDEDQLGATYNELEWAMKMKEEGKSAANFSGREKVVFEIYDRLNTVNKHKIDPIPVCTIPKELRNHQH